MFLLPTSLIRKVKFVPALSITKNPKDSKRVALVIGNGAYKIEPLTNPANDAHDMATILREVGFEVIVEFNVNKARPIPPISTEKISTSAFCP